MAYHTAMDYLHRPLKMEHMPMYQYYREMEFTSLRKAQASEEVHFEYTDEHPCCSTDAVIYRKRHCVPVLGWTWIGCTKDFETSMLTHSKKTDRDYTKKEEYAKRFMTVFLPCRKLADLKKEGSYQVAFQAAHANGLFSDEMLEVADNYQSIQCSIDAGMPENPLTADTELVEADDFQAEDENSDQSDLLASIAELFASDLGETSLEQEAASFNPSFSGSELQEQRFIPDVEPELDPTPLLSVLENPHQAQEEMQTEPEMLRTTRFQTKTSELNALYMQQLLVTREEDGDTESGAGTNTVKAIGTWQSVVAWGINSGLDKEQQIAFQILVATYVLTFYEEAERDEEKESEADYLARMEPLKKLARRDKTKNNPLRLFVTGPAGAGKCKFEKKIEGGAKMNFHVLTFCSMMLFLSAKMLDEVTAYAKVFSQNIRHVFTSETIKITAITGAAAMEIGGTTTASEFGYMNSKCHVSPDKIRSNVDTRLNIIDEISFAGYETVLVKVSDFLQKASECTDFAYGKTAMCFLGDFCQLEAMGKDQIYNRSEDVFWEQSLNCVVELKGTHRYRDCELYGRIMTEIRNKGLSDENRKILNARVINGNTVKMPTSKSTQYATFHNKNRCAINMDIFRAYLKEHHSESQGDNIPDTAVVIKCNSNWGKSKAKLSYGQRKVLFEQCSEADCSNSRSKHIDPLLCLFSGSNQMINENEDVKRGIANGTTAEFKKAILKENANLIPIRMFGYWVYSVGVDDVKQLELEWKGSDRFRGRFRVSPIKGTYRVQFPISEFGREMKVKAGIQITQFPVVGNSATTGHKLQGKSVNEIVVAEWSKLKNWAYVILSRVRTLKGLFLAERIPVGITFAPLQAVTDMMKRLRKKLAQSINTEVEGWVTLIEDEIEEEIEGETEGEFEDEIEDEIEEEIDEEIP